MTCLNDISAIRYAADSISVSERIQMESHMAECEQCLDRIRNVLILKENFENVWNSWTAYDHGRVLIQLKILRNLKKLETLQPSYAEKIKNWLRNLRKETEIALNIFIDGIQRKALIAGRFLPSNHHFQLRPLLTGIGSPLDQTAVEERMEQGSDYLSKGLWSKAEQEIDELKKINARAAHAAVSEIYDENGKKMEAALDGRRNRLSVKLWTGRESSVPKYLMLIPAEESYQPLMVEFEYIEDESFFLAEAEGMRFKNAELIVVY